MTPPCSNCGALVEGVVIDETYNICPKCIYTGLMAALELNELRDERFTREITARHRRLWRWFRDKFFYRPMGART